MNSVVVFEVRRFHGAVAAWAASVRDGPAAASGCWLHLWYLGAGRCWISMASWDDNRDIPDMVNIQKTMEHHHV
jgi:hypothetical protein